MEQGCSNNSEFSKLRVLLIPLEFTAWERARSWTYASQLGFEEGFIANNVEFFTIPVLQEIPSSSPACWLYYARQLCRNKRFDQVWVSLVHPQYDDAFLNWLKEIAPVRVGFLMESLEFTMQELQIHPHLKKRRETAENQIRYMTHILAFDEADAEQISKQGQCRSLWYPSAVPERFLAESPVINCDKAIFGGSVYAERHKWLKQYDLQSLLVWHISDDNSTDYPKLFDEANRQSITFLQQNKNPSEEFLLEYLKALRNIRRHCFQLWLNSLKTGCAVVNLPHVFKAYAGRVVEAMAAGRPVISWEIPDRPRNKTLFENGSEILLFDKSRPQQLADHIRHIQNNPDFAYQLADNALIKMRKFHTIENRVRQVLDWIETGTEPEFGEVEESIELKQDKKETLSAPAGTYRVDGQKHHHNEPAGRSFVGQRDSAAKSYFIKKGYQCNLDTKGNATPYFDDVDSSSSFQADVYRFAADVIKKYRLKNVLDIGCGFGIKLSQHIYPICHDITGIDVEHAIEFCKRKHNFGKWFIDDIEKPDLHLDRQFDLIIAADVIEHLANPDALLEYINSYCHSETLIILSTPERDTTRGKDSFGPPLNETHVREWNMSEFHKYTCSYGFKIIQSCLVKDRDVSLLKSCQVLLCGPGIGLQRGQGGETDLKMQIVPFGELPAVSVVIPCYNQAQFLPEAVESIINQTFRDWECIIVNDGSTDNTSEVADSLIAKYADKRIRLVEKENGGLADARNAGIMAATADWILPLDSDDMFERTFMQKAVDIIQQEEKVDVVFANMQKFGAERGEWIPDEYSQQQVMAGNTMPYSSVFRKQLWLKVEGYSNLLSAIDQSEDWNFWISCSKHNPVVKRIPEKLFLYRVSPQSMYHRMIKDNWNQTWALIATCHPDLYPIEKLIKAWRLIASSPDIVFEKILKAIEKCPQHGRLFFWRGLRNERDGRIDEAISDYKIASEKAAKDDWQAYARLSGLYEKVGDVQAAQRNIEKVLTIRPDFRWAKDILVKLQPKTSSRSEKLKILFYYDGLSNFDKNLGGTVMAVLSFAKMLLHSRPDVVIHLTGAHVQYHRQYESFHLIPLPQEDKRDEFIGDYNIVFFVTHFRYFKGIARPPGQIWVLYQHCWDMAGGALARMNDFDVVLCLSKAHANELSRYGVPVHKQIIVPNLVDTDFYCPQDVERKGHSIMYAGAVHEHKGVHILLDAFRLVRQIIRDIELHIYGSRSMWTGTDDYENRIKAARTEGVYLHGYIDIKDMPKVYSKHSILCLPSKLESFGLVTVEAQACGCIPVVHNAGGAAATLLDDQTGFLYSPNNKEQLGRAILKAVNAVDTNSSIRQKAIDFIRNNFSTNKAKRYISKLWDRFTVAGEVNAVKALFEGNNIDSAGVECGRLLQKYPEHPDLLLLEALIQLHRGDTKKCKSMLLDLVKKFDHHQMAINNLGVLLMSGGQQAEALKFFIKALNINPYDRNTLLNCSIALKISGRHKEAKTALLNYLSKVGEEAQVLSLVHEIDNLIKGADLKPHIGSQQLLEKKEGEHIKQGRTGIIVFGHTRPLLLRNVLESLRRQGTTNDVHVWLDGHHGRASLIKPVQQCVELVKTQFPQVHLRTMNGNVGIEKLMIDGLSFMASRYERIIVLEDDCFPASCAIEEFEKALDEIEQRPEVYSVYGHHFLTESESETITRFQGWGWATTRQKLLPLLTEMKKCFAMSESEYLQWARKNLTPEVVKRLDVTPGRNCVHVIASQFCWDGCTCLVTAMWQLVHKKTAKRVIYNCGMGDGSTHFPLNDKFRRPPFNMITPQEVWDYYDAPSGRSTSTLDESKAAPLTPTFLGRQASSPQIGDIVVDGLTFTNVRRTKHKNNSVGFNDKYIIKIEHEKHPLKLRSLSEEIEIIKYLNSKGCVSCPRLVSDGKLKTGERYFIQQLIDSRRKFNTADMVFSILEQKSLGVCQGDLKIENFIFDSDSVCYIIDYDQAIYDERFVHMGNIEYFQWIAQYIVNRWKNHGITNFYTSHGLNKDEIFSLFRNGAFNLAATTIFEEQITTDSDSGIYHSLNTDKLYIEGARDLNPRLDVLNTIEFKDGEKVLDVGCNMGLLAHYLHDRGCTVTGIDMDRKIIIGAKMVANILNRNIQFECLDVDEAAIEKEYDTICLFSVIHHIKNFKQVTDNMAQKCNRIILECGLRERGSKPIGGKWTATSGWQFNSLQQVIHYLETAFRGFKFKTSHGSVDRDRHIISFVRKPAAAPIQIQSESPIDIRRENLVAQQPGDESEYLVTAVVSTYNSEWFLPGCLQDLENQTIADKLEIIVVDSASQENEEAIVRQFQQRYNNIVYIKTEQREGVYAAWNRAVKAARGRFLTNANTDDRHREDALEVMVNTLLANPDMALVYGDQICTDTPNGTFASHHATLMAKRPDYSRERLLFGCCVGSQPMWRKSLHNEFGYFDETLTCAADWDFWLRISSKYKFKHIHDFLGLYYHNKDGVEHGRKIHSLYERYVVGKRYGTPYISVIPLYNTRDNPLVSVIMPAYNAAEYISEAIESVLIQNYRNFELIVVDDGSIDNTKDIITGFSDERIKYFYQENSGPAATNNEGIKKSRGAFLIRLDSDDIMTPDFIARHLQQFLEHPEADLVYCDDCLIDENDRPIRVIERREYSDRKSLIRDLFRCGFPVVPFRTCIRRSVFDKIGLFDESLPVAEDYDMMRRFVKHALKAHHLKGALYLRRIASSSLTRNYSAQNAKCHFDVVKRFIDTFSCDELFPDVDWDKIPAELRQIHAKCLAAVTFLAIGQTYVKSNLPLYADMAFGQACSQLTDCLKMDPANQRVRQILQKCRLAQAKYSGSVKQAAGGT